MTNTSRRPSLLYPVLASLGVSVLMSCAEQPKPPPPAAAVEEAPPPKPLVRRRHVPLPTHKPEPPPDTATPEAQGPAPEAAAAAVAMTEPAAAPAPPALRPSQLIGLDEPAARRLLGAAAEQAEEPPAKVWRYKTAACELDLYFYYDLRNSRMRALRYSFKGDAADKAKQEECMSAVAAARHG